MTRRLARRWVRLAWAPALGGALLALSLVVLTGDPPPAATSPGSERTVAAQSSRAVDRLWLVDGEALEGRLVGRGATHLSLERTDGRVVLVPVERVAREQLAARPAPAGPPVRRRLRSGREVQGWVLQEDEARCELRLLDGTIVTLRRKELAE